MPLHPLRMFTRITDSLAFRLGPPCRFLAERLYPPFPRKPALAGPFVVTMSGKKHLQMFTEMLSSLSSTWKAVPRVVVVSDGSLEESDLKRLRSAYSNVIELRDGVSLERHHAERGRPELAEFCRVNYFGKKLALMIAAADEGAALWVDNDVLFYGDFSDDLQRLAEGAPMMGATRDCAFGKTKAYFGYDVLLAETLINDPSAPAINAGFTFLRGGVYEALDIVRGVRRSLELGNSYLSEQTLVAWSSRRSGGILWDRDKVFLEDADARTLRPTYVRATWKARHYTGNVRHLFWRDALARRWIARKTVM